MTTFEVTALAGDGAPVAALARVVDEAVRGHGATPVGHAERPGGVRAWVEAEAAAPARARAVALRCAIAETGRAVGLSFDLAVRPANSAAAAVLVFDMDSTLITIEVIDELARRHGVGAEVAAVTESAMRGELDFEASLRARVAKLRGLPAATLDEVGAALPLSPGAAELVAAMHARGVAVAIASGGFTFAADRLARRLGLAAAVANSLEIADGALTGVVVGDVVTAERKAQVVRELCARRGVPPDAAIAIGDGANDRLMLAAAGFGVAFRAKPALRAAADATIEHGGLDRVLAMIAP